MEEIIMKLQEILTIDHVQFSEETPNTLDEILDSAELGILLAITDEKNYWGENYHEKELCNYEWSK